MITNEESNIESPDADGIQVLDEEIVGPDTGDATRVGNLELEIRSDTTSSSLDETDIGIHMIMMKHMPLKDRTSSC